MSDEASPSAKTVTVATGEGDASRGVLAVVTAFRQTEGAGFVVRRPFPSRGLPLVDPFLLLDEMGPVDYLPDSARGAPDHPHRGFETVTYVLEGEIEHEDSAGNRGSIGPGDVQWMTAGAGVVHSEVPARRIVRDGGRMHGFQLWVNLPARDKLIEPRYQEIPEARIPEARTEDGLARVRVLAGEALGVSAVIVTRTPIAYHDWTLEPAARVRVRLPREFQGFVYVFRGEARVGRDARSVRDGQLAVLAALGPARLLLVAGLPLQEPVARWGPYVMNTEAEVFRAMEDYESGRMGRIVRDGS
jgi:redox-sensitive bicupin YhaK (pirin superfamily)